MNNSLRTILVALAAIVAATGWTGTAEADDQPSVLFVPHGSLPGPLRGAITAVIRQGGEVVSTSQYFRAAQRQRVRPHDTRALQRIAPRMGADVIVVASWRSWGRSRIVRITYRSGRNGDELFRVTHSLPGVRLDTAAQRGILREVRMAYAAAQSAGGEAPRQVAEEEPEEEELEEPAEVASSDEEEGGGGGGLPPPSWEDGGAEEAGASSEALEEDGESSDLPPPEHDVEEESSASGEELPTGVDLQAAAGFGFGARSASVPSAAGPVTFSTSPFPAVHVAMDARLRTSQSFMMSLGARYMTSVGLRTKEIRNDGSTRTVDARSQYVGLGTNAHFHLTDGANPTMLELGAGWNFRLFSSELPLAMPEYTLSGPFARVGLMFPIGSSPISIGIAPEIGGMTATEPLQQENYQVNAGLSIGAEASVRVRILDALDAEIVYREAHAFVDSDLDDTMTDVQRFGVLRAVYRPLSH